SAKPHETPLRGFSSRGEVASHLPRLLFPMEEVPDRTAPPYLLFDLQNAKITSVLSTRSSVWIERQFAVRQVVGSNLAGCTKKSVGRLTGFFLGNIHQ